MTDRESQIVKLITQHERERRQLNNRSNKISHIILAAIFWIGLLAVIGYCLLSGRA